MTRASGGRVLLMAGATAAGAAVTFALVVAFMWILLVVSGRPVAAGATSPFVTFSLVSTFLAALLGGGVAAALGGALLPAAVLAAVLVLLSAVPLLTSSPDHPVWYVVAVAVLGGVGAVAGGVVAGLRRPRSPGRHAGGRAR